jgi:hypothetical protein
VAAEALEEAAAWIKQRIRAAENLR